MVENHEAGPEFAEQSGSSSKFNWFLFRLNTRQNNFRRFLRQQSQLRCGVNTFATNGSALAKCVPARAVANQLSNKAQKGN